MLSGNCAPGALLPETGLIELLSFPSFGASLDAPISFVAVFRMWFSATPLMPLLATGGVADFRNRGVAVFGNSFPVPSHRI